MSIMNKKKLSVIMTSYNTKEYISETIESCLNQRLDYPYEIIIGDDGSDDGSIEVIQKYANRYPDIIRFFVMDRDIHGEFIPSIRVSNLLKKGFEYSTGEYLAVIACDDLYSDMNKFQKQIDFLKDNPEYKSCYTDYEKFYPDGEREYIETNDIGNRPVLWGTEYIHIACFVFKRDVLSYLLANFCDDTGLMYSILKAGKTKHIKLNSFAYRQREKSIMHQADMIELNVLEILLYEDIVSGKNASISDISRFAYPMSFLYKNRHLLSQQKYRKYINFSDEGKIGFLSGLNNFQKCSLIYRIRIVARIFEARIIRRMLLIMK